MHAFNQQICSDHGLRAEVVYHRRIIANGEDGRWLLNIEIPGKVFDEAKLPEGSNFSPLFHNLSDDFVDPIDQLIVDLAVGGNDFFLIG
jgi:hypothetical protein